MKIQCIDNSGKNLPLNLINKSWGYEKYTKFEELTVGKEYTVYALTVLKGYFWYYIEDDHFLYYPVFKPAVLFKISDPRISRFWQVGFREDKNSLPNQIIAFKEWVTEPFYYDLLIDNNEREVTIYEKYKKLMCDEVING